MASEVGRAESELPMRGKKARSRSREAALYSRALGPSRPLSLPVGASSWSMR